MLFLLLAGLPVCPESVSPPLQVCPCLGGCRRVLGHELGYFADEVGLFGAAFARLAPLVQNFLQVLDFQLLQVHCGQVQLLVCRTTNKHEERQNRPAWTEPTRLDRTQLTVSQLADLTVLLLELLADLVHRDVVAERFGHFVYHLCGGVARRADVVTLDRRMRRERSDQNMFQHLNHRYQTEGQGAKSGLPEHRMWPSRGGGPKLLTSDPVSKPTDDVTKYINRV